MVRLSIYPHSTYRQGQGRKGWCRAPPTQETRAHPTTKACVARAGGGSCGAPKRTEHQVPKARCRAQSGKRRTKNAERRTRAQTQNAPDAQHAAQKGQSRSAPLLGEAADRRPFSTRTHTAGILGIEDSGVPYVVLVIKLQRFAIFGLWQGRVSLNPFFRH